jgi:two-component system phosphate regulon sensor histidine kinase PhoR
MMLPLIVIVVVISWEKANTLYDLETKVIESRLYEQALKVQVQDRTSRELQQVKFALFDDSGKLLSGSCDDAQKSLYLEKSLAGTLQLVRQLFNGKEQMSIWGRSVSGGAFVVTSEFSVNYGRMFTFIFIRNMLLGLLLTFLFSKLVSRKISEGLMKVELDLNKVSEEGFGLKKPPLQCLEFNSLYDSINNMSRHYETLLSGLREDLKQWAVLFSTIPRGLLVVDSERKIINCNQNIVDMFNLKHSNPCEVEGHTVGSIFENDEIDCLLREFFDKDTVLEEYEFKILINNIDESIKVLCVELDLSGQQSSSGVLMIAENVTALRRLEGMRKDFVANVSHELKTPISIIGGFAETLKECFDDPESALNFINIIEKNTRRLNLIIDDLLSLSKLEQNEEMFRKDFESGNIQGTIMGAVDLCSRDAQKNQIRVILNLEDSKYYEEGSMVANHRLLEQAIRNLLENAISYSPSGTEVVVSSRKIKDEIEISVTDHGAGIDSKHHEKIFERFYRVDKSRDRQTGGSGLGLAIVKHILRIHSGHVSLESKPGEGSCFTLRMPYRVKNSWFADIA